MAITKKTTVDLIRESDKTALYSISFEVDGTTWLPFLSKEESFGCIAYAYLNRLSFWAMVGSKRLELTKRIPGCTDMYLTYKNLRRY